jgi:hypothetical protein
MKKGRMWTVSVSPQFIAVYYNFIFITFMKTYNFVLGGQNGKFRRYQCINVMEICVYHAKIKLYLSL